MDDPSESLFEDTIAVEARMVVLRGTGMLAALSCAVSIACAIMGWTEVMPASAGPVLFSLMCFALSVSLHILVRFHWLTDRAVGAAVMAAALVPTLFLAVMEGYDMAAPFLLGPSILAAMLLVILTGYFLRPRLSVVAGLLAAAGYGLIWALTHHHFEALDLPPGVWTQEIADAGPHAIRASFLAFAGLGIASLGDHARSLLRRVAEEQRERARVRQVFGEYVDDAVAAHILESRGALRGEAKEVAVLFCDMRGFTAMSESTPPEVLVARLNAYLDAMVEQVNAEGGVVDKFIGDAVMAVFGGVRELSDPCGAALRAARGMRSALGGLNHQEAPLLDNGIGLHWGTVIQGAVGSHRRREFTVIGDAVNVAARLEALTKERGEPIVVSRAFADQLSVADRSRLRELGDVRLKGKAIPVAVLAAREDWPATNSNS